MQQESAKRPVDVSPIASEETDVRSGRREIGYMLGLYIEKRLKRPGERQDRERLSVLVAKGKVASPCASCSTSEAERNKRGCITDVKCQNPSKHLVVVEGEKVCVDKPSTG